MFKIRIAKNTELKQIKKGVIRGTSILSAIVLISILILSTGYNPVDIFTAMTIGAFKSANSFREVIVKSIPLLVAAIGISVAFKMKFWNIGAEGQIAMGAFGASLIALKFGDMPSLILIPLMITAGGVAGGVWSGIAAFFKAEFGTNETIFTLMLNYIALKWIIYLQYGPWKDPNAMGFPKIADFSKNAVLPKFSGIHIGVYIALIIVLFFYIFINYTKKGYEIRVIGESKRSAEYAGMKVKNIIISTVFLSGAICGIAGFIQVSGVSKTLASGIAGGNGYSAIIVAWLANLNAGAMITVSLLFAAMIQGGAYVQMMYGIPQSAAEIMQGIILFFVLGGEFFIKYKVIFERRWDKN